MESDIGNPLHSYLMVFIVVGSPNRPNMLSITRQLSEENPLFLLPKTKITSGQLSIMLTQNLHGFWNIQTTVGTRV